MAISTYSSPRSLNSSSTADNQTANKSFLWEEENRILNLPPWIYTDNEPPLSVKDCKAKISALNYTIQDIDLQIQIRELELHAGSSRHNNSFDYEKWKIQALKAKQTHYYLLNAYNYWLIKHTPEKLDIDEKFRKLITLLADEPSDFVKQIESLLD
jgi:hypothetical protein